MRGYCCYIRQHTLPALYHKATFFNLVALGIFMRFLAVHKEGSTNLLYKMRWFFKEKNDFATQVEGEKVWGAERPHLERWLLGSWGQNIHRLPCCQNVIVILLHSTGKNVLPWRVWNLLHTIKTDYMNSCLKRLLAELILPFIPVPCVFVNYLFRYLTLMKGLARKKR